MVASAGAPQPERDNNPQLIADHHAVAQQDERHVAEALRAARSQSDPFHDDFRSVRNLLFQLWSLKRGWDAIQRLEPDGFDAYLMLRPDLRYLDTVSIDRLYNRLDGAGSILVPAWHSFWGLNDRCAFADPQAAQVYANRLDHVVDYCASRPLHSESFLAHVIASAGIKVGELPVRAERVRADGIVRTAIRQRTEDFAHARLPIPRRAEPFADAPARFRGQPASAILPAPVLGPVAIQTVTVANAGKVRRMRPLNGLPYADFLKALHRRLGPVRYLEIGVYWGASLRRATGPALAIDPHIRIDRRRWRDKIRWRLLRPRLAFHEMESDSFFGINQPRHQIFEPRYRIRGEIDLAFIDGMHRAEFALRDFNNVEKISAPGSMIVLHDALPINYEMTERTRNTEGRIDHEHAHDWTGDVWRLLPELQRLRPDLKSEILDCPPTGLVVIRNLDPTSKVLDGALAELEARFEQSMPNEDGFWDFIGKLDIVDSRAWLATNRPWLDAMRRARATSLAKHVALKLANIAALQFRVMKSYLPG